MPEGIVKLTDQSLARLFTITPIGLIVAGNTTLSEMERVGVCFDKLKSIVGEGYDRSDY